MRPRMQPCRQVIEQERRQWMPFHRALAKEDQEAFDRLCACAKEPRQAEVQLGRPWRFEVVWMAVLSAHAKRLEQARTHVEAIGVETHVPEGNPPT
jgi:hypothetical protein